jgi:hypothetical protein
MTNMVAKCSLWSASAQRPLDGLDGMNTPQTLDWAMAFVPFNYTRPHCDYR